MAPADRWPVNRESPPGVGSSVFVGPLALPEQPRKRRWFWGLLWTLLVFAGGVVAGPTVTGQAIVLVKAAYSMLGMTPPQLVEQLKPAAPTPVSTAPLVEPLPAPGVEERAGAPTVATRPAQPDKPAGVAALPPAARAGAATTQGRPETAAAGMPVARPLHPKSEARAPSAKAVPERTADSTPAAAPAAARAASRFHDPFAEDSDSASQPAPAAPTRKSKESSEEHGPTAKSEPAPKPTASSSRDSLDNLMADVVTDRKDKPRAGKGKGKGLDAKGLDAMLSEVQDGRVEPPPPRREVQAPLPPLSQADISRVMAGVKMRGKTCARKFNQGGVAELSLVVGKDGSVTDARVGGNLAKTSVGACIEEAARAAAFPRSAGLRFDYRVDVR